MKKIKNEFWRDCLVDFIESNFADSMKFKFIDFIESRFNVFNVKFKAPRFLRNFIESNFKSSRFLRICAVGLFFSSNAFLFAFDFSACRLSAARYMEAVGDSYGIAIEPLDAPFGSFLRSGLEINEILNQNSQKEQERQSPKKDGWGDSMRDPFSLQRNENAEETKEEIPTAIQDLEASMLKVAPPPAFSSSGTPSKAKLFYYSPNGAPAGYRVIKHDPFIGFFLLESKSELLPMPILPIGEDILEDEIASITPRESVSGKIVSLSRSPRHFALLNIPTFKNSFISSVCDRVYGIGLGEQLFLERHYLARFMKSLDVYYGDIGIRVILNEKNQVVADVIDPFFPNNPFLRGDVILSVDNQNIATRTDFERIVYDLVEGKEVAVKILRNNEEFSVSVAVDHLRGGMLLPENFFERVGLEISPDFTIKNIAPTATRGFEKLKKGDIVMRVNGLAVPHGIDEIIALLGQFPDKPQTWLISRNDFQFFVRVNELEEEVENE